MRSFFEFENKDNCIYNELMNDQAVAVDNLPVMAAVAVRKKVVSIGHFSPGFFISVTANLFIC